MVARAACEECGAVLNAIHPILTVSLRKGVVTAG
jgi:hypothetical protein